MLHRPLDSPGSRPPTCLPQLSYAYDGHQISVPNVETQDGHQRYKRWGCHGEVRPILPGQKRLLRARRRASTASRTSPDQVVCTTCGISVLRMRGGLCGGYGKRADRARPFSNGRAFRVQLLHLS